jgi:hypothetical protein
MIAVDGKDWNGNINVWIFVVDSVKRPRFCKLWFCFQGWLLTREKPLMDHSDTQARRAYLQNNLPPETPSLW